MKKDSIITKMYNSIEFIIQFSMLGLLYWILIGFLNYLFDIKDNLLENAFVYILSYTIFYYFIIDKLGSNKMLGKYTQYIKGVIVIITVILLMYYFGDIHMVINR